MNRPQVSDHAVQHPSSLPSTRLHGRSLLLVRVAWLITALLMVGLSIAGLVVWYPQMQQVCMGTVEECGQQQQLTSAGVQTLQQAGLSLHFYAAYRTFLALGSLLVSWFIAAVIFWRKSDDWIALFVALFLMLIADNWAIEAFARAYPAWWLLTAWLNFLAAALFILFYLFPNGRFIPRWTRWLSIVWIVSNIGSAFLPGSPIDVSTWPEWLFGPFWLGFLLSCVGAQLYRYQRVSTVSERQQTKWVVFGVASAIVGFVSLVLITVSFEREIVLGSRADVILRAAFTLPWVLLSLSFGMAVLRSRLFDIDVIINRTLVYGVLTMLLTVVFVSLVIVSQQAVELVTGQQESQLAIVASTLAIAALFTPLRRRLQAIIDRRFYRRRYDAQKTLEAFSARLREETNLDQLTDDVVNVVQETLQPAHVSLWVLEPKSEGQR